MVNIIGTGGGGSLLDKLTRNGGASQFLYGFNFPYNTEQIDKLLGFKPQEYCSARMSQHLAWAAFKENASTTKHVGLDRVGVGFCCSLKKENEREGREHKTFATQQYNDEWLTYEIPVPNTGRAEQEEIVALALKDIINRNASSEDFLIGVDSYNFNYLELASNKSTSSLFGQHLIPGSFNPIHHGHQAIIDYALPNNPSIEISMSNADKPNISFMEIQERFDKIKEVYPNINLIITDMSMFWKKCEEAEITFYVGSDTYNRIIDIKYYESHEDMLKKIKYIASTNTLYVFDRPGHTIKRDSFLEMILQPNFVDIETPNISSTEIRNGLVC